MSRRGRSSNPISLFSFQDIITSVTGIMILVTLLMALDLSQRVLQSPRVRTVVLNQQLEIVVSDAEDEIQSIESQIGERDAALQRLAGYDRRRLLEESADVKRHVAQLEMETLKLVSEADVAQRRRAEIESRGESREDDMERAAEMAQKIAQLQRTLEKLQKTNRIIYNPAKGSSKLAWLVELTDQTIRAAPMGRAAQPTVFAGKSLTEIVSSFSKWAKGRDRRSEYFVLLIKPSGIEAFERLREELTDGGFDIGFDVVDDQVTVIDPQTGAGV